MADPRSLPLVLVHGGGFDARCWDLLLPHLDGPVLAVDLPGRGRHPAPLDEIDLGVTAASLVADIDDAGFDEVALVGHSLAGCTLPGAVARLGVRVRYVVYVACTLPPHGSTCIDTLPPDIQDLARSAAAANADAVLDRDLARVLFGNDLDESQFEWMAARMVPEAPGLLDHPVDLAPLRGGPPSTWVRPLHDAVVDAEKQLAFAANAGEACRVVDIDAAHMCMISQPHALAALLAETRS